MRAESYAPPMIRAFLFLMLWVSAQGFAAFLAIGPALAAESSFPKDTVGDREEPPAARTGPLKFPYLPEGPLRVSYEAWYAEILSSMNEPVLARPDGETDNFAIRLVIETRSEQRPIAVRIERRGTKIVRRTVMLKGPSLADLDEPDSILLDQQSAVSAVEFAELLAEIRQSGFWQLAPEDRHLLADGSMLFVEVIDGDRHMVVVRSSPHYRAAIRGLTGLTAFYRKVFRTVRLEAR